MQKIKRIKSLFSTIVDLFQKYIQVKYIDLLSKFLKDCKTILDLGCGKSSPIRTIRQKNTYALGVDIFEDYINFSKKREIHNDYLIINILDIDKNVLPKSFDCVLLLDVIEHLKKIDGIRLIKKLYNIAKKKIIIFTPNGFLPQKRYHNNIYQIHHSGWDLKILKKIGFKIYGVHGFKFIYGERIQIKLKPIKFWNRIAKFSSLFVKFFPLFAIQLLCIKEL